MQKRDRSTLGLGLGEGDSSDNDTINGPLPIYEIPCADLEPSTLLITPGPVPAGGFAYADWETTNVGNGATNAPFWFDRIYLSVDQILDGNDRVITPDFRNPMALNPGEAYPQNVQFTVPADLLGSYYVIVKSDARNDLGECLEDNNVLVSDSMLQIDPPPFAPVLTMTNCGVDPPVPWPGDRVTVNWTITNTGQVPTGPFTIDHALALSMDDILSPGSDAVLAWHVGELSANLAPGETSAPISATANIPYDAWGPSFIIVWPDPPLWVDLDRSPCAIPITVQTGLPADLEVDAVMAPAGGSSGQPVDISWTVSNATVEPTHVAWWDDSVYLSRDNDFGTPGDNILIGTFRHNGILNFDEIYTGSEQGRAILPNDAEGLYYVFVQVDVSDRVYEDDWEQNNVGMAGPIEVTYAPPNLVVDTATVLADGAPAISVLSGASVTVEWTVSNTGNGNTPEDSWSDRIYVSADNVLDDGDPVLADASHAGTLDVDQSYSGSRTVTIPPSFSSPSAYVFVRNDRAGQVFESDNDNNDGVADPFEVIWAPSDLVVQSVTVDTGGGPIASGSTVTVEWAVSNEYLGTTATGSWYDRIYISHNGVLDGSERDLATVGHSGALNPNESYTSLRDVTIPIDFVGSDVYILVKTDHDNRVYESDNDNNIGSADPIEVTWEPPDLRIESITAPGGVVAGEAVSLSWMVRNVGGPTEVGAWHDRVYLSVDRWLSDDDLAFDPPIEHISNLAYNSTYVANATVDLPPDLANRFYVIVETDIDDAVSESAEANNTRYVSISLTPLPVDLRVASVDAPETALSGQNMQLAWTVANVGVGATPTGFWRDAVYLSPDQYLDRGFDSYLGYFDHSGILNFPGEVGDAYTRNISVRVPNGLSGPYYIFVCTDINNHVYEENDGGDAEANNCEYDGIAVQMQLPPPVDLVVSDIVVPPSGTLGEAVTIQWTVRNDGAFDAQGSWHDSVYISADTIWDIGDKRIGEVQHFGPLASGDVDGYTESITAPLPGVVPGDYYLIVRTDVRNEVREVMDGEQNNITSSNGQFGATSWELAVGTFDDSHQLSTGTEHYFKIPGISEGEDLLVSLDSDDDLASTELYIRYGTVPDRGHYDFTSSGSFAADHEIVIPTTKAGDYYLLVRGDSVPGGPTRYTVANRLLEFEIRGITPGQAGNSGSITTLIEGSRLSLDTVVRIMNGETVIEGTVWPEPTPTKMFVTFDLREASEGVYDVAIENTHGALAAVSGEAPTVLPGAFEVVAGTGPSLEVHIEAPSTLRVNRPFVVYIAYGNTGDTDLPAPLFSLSASDGVPLRLDPAEDPWPGPVQVLGISMEGPPGILRPGVWQSIPVYSRSPGNAVALEFSLGMMVADATPIDWTALEQGLRPDDIPAEVWAALWANLTTGIGTTWADFLAAMTGAATYLANVGERTYDARELFGIVAKNASGDLGLRLPLALRVDGYSPAPGLPLAFAPVALNNLAQRFHVGPLGRGWSHNFEYSLTRLDDDNILVAIPGGFLRPFTKQPDDSWQGSPGDFGSLEELGGDTYQITEKDGFMWFFGSTDHLASAEEPNGNRITLSYSGDDLVDISHSNGHRFTLAYNAEGRIVSLTDHVGRVTEYLYDGTGEHLTQVIAPGNRVTLYEYEPAAGGAADHALSSITFPDGTHRYYGYDGRGRLAEVSRDAGAERHTFVYSELGTVQVFDADGNASTLRLGPNGQLVQVQDALGHTLVLDYDKNFNLVHLTAPDATKYELGYDNLGNLTESTDPLNAVITLGHTPDLSRLDWLSDARSNVMDFNSDGQGNLTGIVHPDLSSELFDYDGRGEIVTVTNRRGQSVVYTHDAAGRIIRKQDSDGRRTDYAYDAHGNLVSVIDSATGTITMEYDDRDFLTRIEYPGGIWFTFEYNDAGWRTRRTGHDGYVLNYHYDAAGRLERLTDGSAVEIIRYSYDTVGRLAREDKGNGTYTTYAYDAVGQILHLVNYAPDDSVQSRFDYTYDENGNPTSMATLQGTWQYGYDATGQLTDVTYPDGRQVTYEYDLAGNRVTVTDDGVPTEYVTNDLNQYTQVGDVAYGYDADGNMTSKTDATGTRNYEYDIENRLTRVVTPTVGTWEYTYDGAGMRISVTHDGARIRYVHDPIGLIDVAAEYDSGGTLSARYVHGQGLISRVAPQGGAAYYGYDATGHTRQLTDESGGVANAYNYDPFGVLLTKSEAIPNPFQYVGRFGVMRDATGLDFMRARYYQHSHSRFLTPDPLRVFGGVNLYTYTGSSPVLFVDPTGLRLWAPINWLWDKVQTFIEAAVDVSFPGGGAFNAVARRWQEGGGTLGDLGRTWRSGLRELSGLGVQDLIDEAYRESGLQLPRDGTPFGDADYEEVPHFPTESIGGATIPVVAPIDPNEKLGPDGSDEMRFVPLGRSLPYRVNCENLPDATAPAQAVIVTDQLSVSLDWRTFRLEEIAFGDTVVEVPELRARYVGEVPLDNGLIVEIEAGLDIQTGLATWTLTAIDPGTGEQPKDPLGGLLPPNDPEIHDGEGFVTFTIRPRPDLTTGTEITNTATIIFDTNEPVDTNEVFNTIDAVAPTSTITGPIGEQSGTSFDVTWAGQDDDGGSGVVSYSIYYRVVGEPYTLWLTTSDASAPFAGARGGGQYDFYSLATDGAGNTESPPAMPDTTVIIYPAVPPAPALGLATAATVQINDLGDVNAAPVEHAVYEETTQQWVGENHRLVGEPFWQPLDQWRGFQVRALPSGTEFSFTAKARFPESGLGASTVATTSAQGDANGDGLVTQADVTIVQQALGSQFGNPGFDARADLNADDEVTFADLGIVNLMRNHNGDYTGDTRVALDDFRMFVCCMNGPDLAPHDGECGIGTECSHGDMNLDGDLDLADFAAIQRAFASN